MVVQIRTELVETRNLRTEDFPIDGAVPCQRVFVLPANEISDQRIYIVEPTAFMGSFH